MKKKVFEFMVIAVFLLAVICLCVFYTPFENTDNDAKYEIAKYCVKILGSLMLLTVMCLMLKKADIWLEFIAQTIKNKKLIFSLGKNDFKTRYASNYLGTVWAFVQPVITVLLYWFVFQVGLRAGNTMNVPFVLWLIAGLVPWFYFSDVFVGSANSLVEYQYLVKKVVFQVDILPLVKAFSAIFVHVFFVAVMLVIYICHGLFPTWHVIQLVYYSLCMTVLGLGLGYISASIIVFFRDLSQIINIMLQVIMWMTPILWNFSAINLPSWLKFIFELNPLFYIVQGYRDSLITHVWFFERPGYTVYFWALSLGILTIGISLFKKLKVHFADVL